ncbi:MAG: hydroxyisourate hydrolase [Gammaproteobacteria bacterium]|nr:hydroxyisourate hydrolase [Gammaproteobacteria bacterium]
MGRLTTHVLDTAHGKPAGKIRVELYNLDNGRSLVKQSVTNDDGRLDSPLLEGDNFITGRFELVFHAGDYFSALGLQLPDPPFVEDVALRFGISDSSQHYHVPLLVSPWSYSTYRGS